MSQPPRPHHPGNAQYGSGYRSNHGPGPALRQTPYGADIQQNRGPDFQGVPTGPRQQLHSSATYNHSGSWSNQERTLPHNHHHNTSNQPHQQYGTHQPHQQASTYTPRRPPARHTYRQAWSSNTDAYSAMYDDGSSNKRKMSHPSRAKDGQPEASQGIKSRKYGSAFIGKEADQYIREDLREQLDYVSSMGGDSTASAPLDPSRIVFQFKKDGHLDTARKQLLSHFQSSKHKDELLQSLQTYLVQRINSMNPAAREKMAAQEERLQLAELGRWIEDSLEPADMVDDVLKRLRGDANGEGSLFASRGVLGRVLESRLNDAVQAEKRQLNRGESSDEEGGDSTPLNKGSTTSGGSQTPMTIATETS